MKPHRKKSCIIFLIPNKNYYQSSDLKRDGEEGGTFQTSVKVPIPWTKIPGFPLFPELRTCPTK